MFLQEIIPQKRGWAKGFQPTGAVGSEFGSGSQMMLDIFSFDKKWCHVFFLQPDFLGMIPTNVWQISLDVARLGSPHLPHG